MAVDPSGKRADPDFSPMMLSKSAPVSRCTCTCCAGGHEQERMGPFSEGPLGAEARGIAAEALERRHELITKVLLPQAKTLSGSIAKANEQGTVGFGELELLGELQRWILQLQIEADDLRLCLTPPELEQKKP